MKVEVTSEDINHFTATLAASLHNTAATDSARSFIHSQLRSCVKVEVTSEDINHFTATILEAGAVKGSSSTSSYALPVPNSPCGLCGRKATMN